MEKKMPVLAIVGAGPGLGLAIGKIFGKRGFKVALISRSREKLESLVRQLASEKIEAAAFGANVLDRLSLGVALGEVKGRFGSIDVLEFSPVDRSLPLVHPSEVTPANAQAMIDVYVHGAISAVQAVLPDMLHQGSGTMLFTTGASSVFPSPGFGDVGLGNYGPAAAWLRNYAHALHAELAPHGVQVGHVAIGVFLAKEPGHVPPDDLAPAYWDLHTRRGDVERVFTLNRNTHGAAATSNYG
jgi:NAD(P)-dependent dehydrogenase (short-subunit alcohol dehydrogenase family)